MTACGMSRQLAVEIGDIETSEIEHVECSNCLMVLVSMVERLPEAKSQEPRGQASAWHKPDRL